MKSAPHSPARRALLRLSLMGTLLLAQGRAFAAALKRMLIAARIWPSPDYTRVTLECDQSFEQTRHFTLKNPDRLVVDVDALQANDITQTLPTKILPADPFIAAVRVGHFQKDTMRLVFDLKQAVRAQVFTLAPIAPYRWRLVFDLYSQQEDDPLLALLRAQQQAEKTGGNPAGSGAAVPQAGMNSTEPGVALALDDLGGLIREIESRRARAPQGSAAPATPGAPPTAPIPTPDASTQTPSNVVPGGVERLAIVAIDAGHGGEDPGAIGPSGLREKDVTLNIARLLRNRINTSRNIRAVLTRDGDYFVPLGQRVHKARSLSADLFLSIHADAFYRRTARGASVFILSSKGASSAAARWMARRENQADAVGGIPHNQDAQLQRALLDMSTTAQVRDSGRFGETILRGLGNFAALHKGKVERAAFAVLKAPDIPSVLVESGFISNPQEEAQLRQPQYQERLAQSLFAAVETYFRTIAPPQRGPSA